MLILPYHMNTPLEGPPGLRLIPLYLPILLLQRKVGGDIDRCITGQPVAVPCGERQRVNVQIVQHALDGDLGMKFLKYQKPAVRGMRQNGHRFCHRNQ